MYVDVDIPKLMLSDSLQGILLVMKGCTNYLVAYLAASPISAKGVLSSADFLFVEKEHEFT